MKMWFFIMIATLAATGAGLIYLTGRVGNFAFFQRRGKEKLFLCALTVAGLFVITGLTINFINAIVCVIYFSLFWIAGDTLFLFLEKIRHQPFERYYAGAAAVAATVIALSAGWYLDHSVRPVFYTIETDKDVGNLKIAMFADSHIGTTFNAEGFAKHLAAIQTQNPDVVILSGDFVDDDTTRADMIASVKALGELKTAYGVYFVPGNHDKGYYGAARRGFSGRDLTDELERNGVKVLKDEAVLIDDRFYLIGRKDFSVEKEQRGKRKPMKELTAGLSSDKLTVVADHQPADYQNQAAAKVDLVLSGHTHGGQLFPFNRVGKWIGANDKIYGHEKRGDTNFVVTSGLSDWAIKFKTGCRSEYVVITVKTAGK